MAETSDAPRSDRSRLFLIDGYSNIFRAFYAIRNLSNSRGEPTNAVYGFVQMLKKLLREDNPELVGVALDVGKTFRNEKYEDYKANRRPMPEDLASQLPWIRRVLEAYRIPILELAGYEGGGRWLRRRPGVGGQGSHAARRAPRLPLSHGPQQALRAG